MTFSPLRVTEFGPGDYFSAQKKDCVSDWLVPRKTTNLPLWSYLRRSLLLVVIVFVSYLVFPCNSFLNWTQRQTNNVLKSVVDIKIV